MGQQMQQGASVVASPAQNIEEADGVSTTSAEKIAGGQDTSTEKENEKENKEKELVMSSYSATVQLKFFMMQMQARGAGAVDWNRKTATTKSLARDGLKKKLELQKKAAEITELKELRAHLLTEIEKRGSHVEALESRKQKLHAEITKSGLHTAAEIAKLGAEFETVIEELAGSAVNDLLQWTADQEDSLKQSTKFKLLSPSEKSPINGEIIRALKILQAKLHSVKNHTVGDRQFVESTLQNEILVRSRMEIAAYFAREDVDGRALFLSELASKNEVEKDEERWSASSDVVRWISEKVTSGVPESAVTAVMERVGFGAPDTKVTVEEFVNLVAQMYWKISKDCILTDNLDVVDGPFEAITKLVNGDIVRVVGDVKHSNGMTRFLAETCGEGEKFRGWLTQKGLPQASQTGASSPPVPVFAVVWGGGYRVVKQTVLTDIFEMKNFKAVIRLNVGDQIRAIGFPRREDGSGLLRVRGRTVGKKAGSEFTGFVTVEGNQNSVYLENCESLVMPPTATVTPPPPTTTSENTTTT